MDPRDDFSKPPIIGDTRERWYFAREGVTSGPMSLQRLAALYRAGDVRAYDRVWNPKFPEWVDAQDVPGLRDFAPPFGAGHKQGMTSHPQRSVAGDAMVSDRLPLVVLGAIVACFAIYFGQFFPESADFEAKLLGAGSAAKDTAAFDALTDEDRSDHEIYSLEICNSTHEPRLYAAVAYYDEERGDWIARGWFPEDQGACQAAIKNLKAPIYVYAESKDGQAKWGDDGAGQEFCIPNEKAFVIRQKECGYLGGDLLRKQRFRRVKLSGHGGPTTWDLTE